MQLPVVFEPEAPLFRAGKLSRSKSGTLAYLRPSSSGDGIEGLPQLSTSLRRQGKREDPKPITKHRQLLREPGHRPRKPWSLPDLGASRSAPTLPTVFSLPKEITTPMGAAQPYSVCRGRTRRKANWALTVGDPSLLRRALQEVDAMETHQPDVELPLEDLEAELSWLERQRLEARVRKTAGVKQSPQKSRVPRACRDVYGDQDLIATTFAGGDEEPVASEHRRIVATTLMQGGPGSLVKLLTAPRDKLLAACKNSSDIAQHRLEALMSELFHLDPNLLDQDDLAKEVITSGAMEMVQAVRLSLERLGRWSQSQSLLIYAGKCLLSPPGSAKVIIREDYEDLLVLLGGEATVDELLWGKALLSNMKPPERVRGQVLLRGVKKKVLSEADIKSQLQSKIFQTELDLPRQITDEKEIAETVRPALQAAIGLEEPLSELEAIRVDENCVAILFSASATSIEAVRRQLPSFPKQLPPNLCSSVTMHNPLMQRDIDGNTPLHIACATPDAAAVKARIKACPDSLKARNVCGFQPFEWLLRTAARGPERQEALKVLIASGVADPRQSLTRRITPLMWALPEEVCFFEPRSTWSDIEPLFMEGQTADELLLTLRQVAEPLGLPESDLPNFWRDIQLQDHLFLPALKGVAREAVSDEAERIWFGWNKVAQARVSAVWKGGLGALLQAASDPTQDPEKIVVFRSLCSTLLEATSGPEASGFDGRWPYRYQLEKMLPSLQIPIADALCTSAGLLRKQNPDGARWLFGDDGGGAVDGSSIWLEPTSLDLCRGSQRLRADFRLGSGQTEGREVVEGEEAPSWVSEPNLVHARESALGEPSMNASTTRPKRSEVIREAIQAPSPRLAASLGTGGASIMQLHGVFVQRSRALLFNQLAAKIKDLLPAEVSVIEGGCKGLWSTAEVGLADTLRACEARLRHVEIFYRFPELRGTLQQAHSDLLALAAEAPEHAAEANAIASKILSTSDVRSLRRTLALSKLPPETAPSTVKKLPAMLAAASEFYEEIIEWPPPPTPAPAEGEDKGEEEKTTEEETKVLVEKSSEEVTDPGPQPPLNDRELQVFGDLTSACKTGAFFALETATAISIFEDVETLRAAHEKLMQADAATDGFGVIRVHNGFSVLAFEPPPPDEVEPQEDDEEPPEVPEPEPRTGPKPDPAALASSLPPHIKLWLVMRPGEMQNKNYLVVECQLHLRSFHNIGETGQLLRGLGSTHIGAQYPFPSVAALVARAEGLRRPAPVVSAS